MVAAMLIASFKTITAMYKPLKRYLRQKARFYKEFRAFFMPQKVSKQKDIFADFDLLHGIGLVGLIFALFIDIIFISTNRNL